MQTAVIQWEVTPVAALQDLREMEHIAQVSVMAILFNRSVTGYIHISLFFEDIDECMGTNDCDDNAQCNNTIGSYICTCNVGYVGDGLNCTGNGTEVIKVLFWILCNCTFSCPLDIDECQDRPCDSHATCNNTDGSFDCFCNHGFYGDGLSCCKLHIISQC